MLKFCKHTSTIFFSIFWCVFSIPSFAGAGQCVDLEAKNYTSFDDPTSLTFNATNGNWIVTEKTGSIYEFSLKSGERVLIAKVDENLDYAGEGGLMDFIFHANFAENPYVFITRTLVDESARVFVLERYGFSNNRLLLSSKQELFRTIFSGEGNVGGSMAFDNFDNLLVAIGDGDDYNDHLKNALNPYTFPGSIIRLNVNAEGGNYIAAGNPFLNFLDGAAQTFAFGFSDPANIYHDRLANITLVIDNSEASREINQVESKKFYGWSCLDGVQSLSDATGACRDTMQLFEIAQPVIFYAADQVQQLSGGMIYRGRKNPNWNAKYFFSDYISGNIWHVPVSGNRLLTDQIVLAFSGAVFPKDYAADALGEMYFIDLQGRFFAMQARPCQNRARVIRQLERSNPNKKVN